MERLDVIINRNCEWMDEAPENAVLVSEEEAGALAVLWRGVSPTSGAGTAVEFLTPHCFAINDSGYAPVWKEVRRISKREARSLQQPTFEEARLRMRINEAEHKLREALAILNK